MLDKQVFSLSVNGTDTQAFAPSDATLLDVLRGDLGMRAAKRGCNQGVCGACTVMIDGVPMRSCLTMAGACEGREVMTLEGYRDDPLMNGLQEAMINSGGVQCGFCTSGVLITARNLIEETPEATGEDIRKALSGNLCRCTGYVRIVEAIAKSARGGRGMSLDPNTPGGIAVGLSTPKLENREKVTGRAEYIDDLSRPGMLYAAILGSPFFRMRAFCPMT